MPSPLFACIWRSNPETSRRRGAQTPGGVGASASAVRLADVAAAFSPRYEQYDDTLVAIDVSGLDRLLRPPAPEEPPLRSGARVPLPHPAKAGQIMSSRAQPTGRQIVGEALWQEVTARDTQARVAVAGTRTAALVLAHVRPGLTVVAPGEEASALAPVRLAALEPVAARLSSLVTAGWGPAPKTAGSAARSGLSVFADWGIRTLGDVAALPPADLAARLGSVGTIWQAMARGEDTTPLVPTLPEERFEGTVDLEWPMEGVEPLAFVLTRLLEPLIVRLERRDRGAAALHIRLDLTTRESHVRHLQLPAPLRDLRTLRSLLVLDLESHPPAAGIDRVTLVIDPTPGRVLQHALFTRAQPAPEQISTLLARLGALMGQDRVGAPGLVDSYRPGAFRMRPFAAERSDTPDTTRASGASGASGASSAPGASDALGAPTAVGPRPDACDVLTTALVHRYRRPVPARVTLVQGRPARVTTDRRGMAGGQVVRCTGPWRTSGEWWADTFDRDEWDVSLSDGAVYRLACDRQSAQWFIDAIVD